MVLFCLIAEASATEKVSPYLGVGSDAFSFTLESFTPTLKNLYYEPNVPGLSRVGISAYGLGASLSTRAPTTDLDPLKGESKFFDFQIGYNNLKWGVDLYVQNYEGFYLKNSAEAGATTSAPYYLLPNLKFTHYGLMGRWALTNSGFSISGLLNQADEITKTAGSYFIVGGIRHYTLDSDQSLIPTSQQSINPELDDLRKLSVHTLNLGVGAGKYWVSTNKFFFGGVLDISGTLGIYNYEYTTTENSSSYSTLSHSLKLGTGYAGKKWRSGISAYADATTLRSPDQTYIKPQATAFMFYVRYVFD